MPPSFLLSPCSAVVPVPPNVSPDAACTVPTVFLTADACLNAATVVQPGQRVLIHAATGGLGLAAVQVTTALGGVPLGTAGSSTKRAFLRSYWGGVQTAVNSRTTGVWQCTSGAAGCLNPASGCTASFPTKRTFQSACQLASCPPA